MMALGEAEAHLHVLRLDKLVDLGEADLFERYGSLLTDAELARCRRGLVEKKRRESLATRAFVRTTLSRYAAVEPHAWRFAANDHGRPHVESPTLTEPLEFNLAHTEGLIVCLVARQPEIGVDVESVRRDADFLEIAERFFAPEECVGLRSLPEPERRERFYAIWTLKEAYIKARGLGLAIPLDAFWFDIGRNTVMFDHRIADDTGAWWFQRDALSLDHVCAIAMRTSTKTDIAIRVIEA